MGSFSTSTVRVGVPVVVGLVVSSLTRRGVTLTVDEALFLNGAVTLVYYVAVRYFETFVAPRAGWLLGKPTAPAYAPPPVAPAAPRKRARPRKPKEPRAQSGAG